MHRDSIQALFRVDALEHEDPIVTLFCLHFQEIAECARHNLEVTTQLINKHINLTCITPRDQAVVHIDYDN